MSETVPATIGVASLNVLLDKTRSGLERDDPAFIEPQIERVDSLGDTLRSLPISPDVVMLQEVHVTDEHHAGEEMAAKLGVGQGFWFNHNTSKRKGEYIGVCGELVAAAHPIDLGHDKLAVLTEIEGVAFIGVHLRRTPNPLIKMAQMRTLLKETDCFDKRVIVGDANARPESETRKILQEAGALSVPLVVNGKHPGTWPTDSYRNIMLKRRYQQFIRRKFSLDMFEVIGFEPGEIVQFGVVETPKSDHFTLYGEVAPRGTTSRAER